MFEIDVAETAGLQVFVRLFRVAEVELPAGFSLAYAHDAFWRVYLNAAAGMRLELGGSALDLEPEAFYLIPPRESFSEYVHTPVRHFFIHFDLVGAAELAFREKLRGIIRLPVGKPQRELVAALSSTVASQPHTTPLGLLRVQALVYGLLADFMSRMPEDEMLLMLRFQRAAATIRPALDHIERNLGQPIYNRHMAKACHRSVNQFLRLFRSSMGATPRHYINERRIRQASQDLVFTQDSIETIAARAGFSDRYYFTRIFRRIMGIAPGTYRRSKMVESTKIIQNDANRSFR